MSNPIVVLKFGGSSVGEVRHWDTIVEQVLRHQRSGSSVILVLSALKNISNLLEALLHQAVAGVHPSAISHLKEHHLGFAAQLGLSLEKELAPWFEQLRADCEQIHQHKAISPKLHASVLSIGELLSSTIGCAYLKSRQVDCHFQDVRDWLVANDQKQKDTWHHYTANSCDHSEDIEIVQQLMAKPQVWVTQGFIARDRDNETVLLGREGSDTSAAYLGAKTKAACIEIWTDVPGVFSFNPRSIASARQLKKLSYQQAEELATSGAKVLHPKALAPAQHNNIPLWVKCTAMPNHPGTQISAQTCESSGVIAMAGEKNLLSVELIEGNAEYLVSEMSRMGFDCQHHLSERQWLMRYVNSDVEQPSVNALQEHFDAFRLKLTSNLACICLLGQGEQWQQKTTESITVTAFEVSAVKGNSAMTLVTKNEQYESLCQSLHQALIENNSTSINFGQTWHELTVQ